MPVIKCQTVASRNFTGAINRKFRRLVDDAGDRYTDVADAIGIGHRVAAALYAGTYRSSLSCDVAAAIADYFEVSLDSLRGD